MDTSLFSVIFIFLLNVLSCGHFIIFLSFNILLGHSTWTLYCSFVILILIVDTSFFSCFESPADICRTQQ